VTSMAEALAISISLAPITATLSSVSVNVLPLSAWSHTILVLLSLAYCTFGLIFFFESISISLSVCSLFFCVCIGNYSLDILNASLLFDK
jgi:hypothetical protein